MTVELTEIKTFIAALHPFDLLPEAELDAVARKVTVRYLRRDTQLMGPGDRSRELNIVRSGAIETHSPENQLLARYGEGGFAGVQALLRGGIVLNRVRAIEDTLLYQVPEDEFHRLRDAYEAFAYYFSATGGDRLRAAQAAIRGDDRGLTSRRIGELIAREPITVTRAATIAEAARNMRDASVSCLLVVEDGKLCGILTDRDLRNRVLAADLSPQEPVERIMTSPPLNVPVSAFLFEGLLTMSRRGIHHLPVVRPDGSPAGVITATDILRTQIRSVVFVAGEVHKRGSAAEIAESLSVIPDMVYELVESGASAYSIGHAVSSLADAATERLIALAEAEMGPAPVPYVWMAVGSQGRNEQTARSDQDNCLLLSDDYDPERHGAWFEAFAKYVCDGLDTAGYVHCPGEVMAMTPRWRQSLTGWKRTFDRWIDAPEPKALMYSSVFFDMRPVCGAHALYEDLHAHVLKKAQGSRLFLGHLTGNALTHQPPLGFFRNLVLIHGGEHNKTLDLKHTGIVPITDLARIYTLDAGLPQVNTADRLEAACEAGKISRDGARDLMDALEFLGLVRLRHQARLIREGGRADNYLPPEELSPFERGHLKDAFAVVKAMQNAAQTTYRGGRA